MPSRQRKRRQTVLKGERFGRLVAKKRIEPAGPNGYRWICKCDCGKWKEVRGSALTTGQVQSCGCLRSEKARSLRPEIKQPNAAHFRYIALTRGYIAKVEKRDFLRISKLTWHVLKDKDGRLHAYTRRPGTGERISMGREILRLPTGDGQMVVYADPARVLDYRRDNLLVVPYWGKVKGTNETGFCGIQKKGQRYEAKAWIGGRFTYLGWRHTAEAAHRELYLPAMEREHGKAA